VEKNALGSIGHKIKKLGEEVRKHLGCGFTEAIYQNALAIEFRKNKIDYLKEVNIEIFYKEESVGVDRPDFIITKCDGFLKPILLELKVTDRISDNHRVQLRSYCTSLPHNNNPVLTNFAGGILMAFPSCDIDVCSAVKIFVVKADFETILDEQKDEEEKIRLEKAAEKLKTKKKQ